MAANGPHRGGAPAGNQNSRKGRDWEHALRWALENYENTASQIERGQALRAIAKMCIEQAIAGDKDARTEIANRLDGKPAQPLVGGDEDDSPIRFQRIERAIVHPDPANSDG